MENSLGQVTIFIVDIISRYHKSAWVFAGLIEFGLN
jgi:hypothetical protein